MNALKSVFNFLGRFLTSTRIVLTNLITFVFLGCFVVGMLLTPPDVISQSLLAIPAWLLYELGIIIGRMLTRNKL